MGSVVAIVKTSSNPDIAEIREKVREIVNYLGGWEEFLHTGDRVLLKPNAGIVAGPETARNTDPRLVRAVVLELQQCGIKEIFIGESSVVGVNTREALNASGIEQVARDTGAVLLDLKGEYIEVTVQKPLQLSRIKIAKRALEVDAIINLPKLKTICATPVSLGMKNLKGLLPDIEKKRFHYTDLNKAIVDLNKVIKPTLTIIDGIIASEMYSSRETNLLVGGTDIVAVDSVGAWIIDVKPDKVDYLRLAAEHGLGESNPVKIQVKGCSIKEVFQPLTQAPDRYTAFANMFPEVRIIDGGACSGCVSTLYLALKNSRDRGLLKKYQELKIAIGPRVELNSEGNDVIFLGNCLKRYKDRHFMPGCPFIFLDFMTYLEKGIK
jgi:uncharacterized protein (DUF362 family)